MLCDLGSHTHDHLRLEILGVGFQCLVIWIHTHRHDHLREWGNFGLLKKWFPRVHIFLNKIILIQVRYYISTLSGHVRQKSMEIDGGMKINTFGKV